MRRPRLTYANVVATLALFIALGGVSWAATTISANSVGTTQLKDGAVTGVKIANATITSQKLTSDAIKSLKGQTGDRGLTGLPGAKGDTGSTGPKGDTGAQGPAGRSGYVYSGDSSPTSIDWAPYQSWNPPAWNNIGKDMVFTVDEQVAKLRFVASWKWSATCSTAIAMGYNDTIETRLVATSPSGGTFNADPDGAVDQRGFDRWGSPNRINTEYDTGLVTPGPQIALPESGTWHVKFQQRVVGSGQCEGDGNNTLSALTRNRRLWILLTP